jgi:hypothetical protein
MDWLSKIPPAFWASLLLPIFGALLSASSRARIKPGADGMKRLRPSVPLCLLGVLAIVLATGATIAPFFVLFAEPITTTIAMVSI